jgi:hypothetical protein
MPTQENLWKGNRQQDEGIASDGDGDIPHNWHGYALQLLDQLPLEGLLTTWHGTLPGVGCGSSSFVYEKVGLYVTNEPLDADGEHFDLINVRRERLTEESLFLITIAISIGVGGEEPIIIADGGDVLLKCSGCCW